MVSKYWYETGVFSEVAKGNYIFEKKSSTYDFAKYLHGMCDIFIIKLFEFGKEHNITYPIAVILTDEGLIHAFCWLEGIEDNLDYFIDIRGITCSKNRFFEEFKEMFNYKIYFSDEYYEDEDNIDLYGHIEIFYSLDEYLEFVKNYFNDEEYFEDKEILEESKNIIESFKENYLFPNWIAQELD